MLYIKGLPKAVNTSSTSTESGSALPVDGYEITFKEALLVVEGTLGQNGFGGNT